MLERGRGDKGSGKDNLGLFRTTNFSARNDSKRGGDEEHAFRLGAVDLEGTRSASFSSNSGALAWSPWLAVTMVVRPRRAGEGGGGGGWGAMAGRGRGLP